MMRFITNLYNFFLLKLISYYFFSWLIILVTSFALVYNELFCKHDLTLLKKQSSNLLLPETYMFSLCHLALMFCICWCWFGLMIGIHILLCNKNIKNHSTTLLGDLLRIKRIGVITFNRFSQLVLNIFIRRQRSSNIQLISIYFVIGTSIILLSFISRYQESFFLFIYCLIPIISITYCFVDYLGDKGNIRFYFASNILRFYVYAYLHAIFGCLILSVCFTFVVLLSGFVLLANIPLILVWLFFFVTIPTLVANISLLLLSVIVLALKKIM